MVLSDQRMLCVQASDMATQSFTLRHTGGVRFSYVPCAGIKYDYGQVTVEELDLDDELAEMDLEDEEETGPDRERGSAREGHVNQRLACANFERHGSCANGDRCQYAHGPTNNKSSGWHGTYPGQSRNDRVCRNFATGQCMYGDRCNFTHVAYPPAELRPPAGYYSSPSSSRNSTPAVSRPGSASASRRGSASRPGSAAASRPGSAARQNASGPSSAAGQSAPRVPIASDKLSSTFNVPADKV